MNILLLALVPACFALNPVTGRALADVMGPASLTTIRWALSGIIIALIAVRHGSGERWAAPAWHFVQVASLGALGMGFCAYAAYEAVRTSPATNVSLIYGCASAVIAGWEIAAGRQRLTSALALGIGACLAGVVLVVTRGHPETLLHLRFTPGDLWATAGMLGFVAYTIALRRAPAAYTSLTQFVIMSCGATVAFLPFAIAEASATPPTFALWMLPWLAAVVLATGIGGILGYNIALKRNGPVLTSAALTLTPLYAAVQATLLIGEQLGWYHGLALLLVVGGLLLVSKR